ncbi:dTMP kinase [Streptomyces sp. NPDC058964]|uniref:dTMP kinase n=1 Tax=Streptomyces sp. NPDC058964 TaxID=3346681 RepID=UPI00367549DE
MRLNLSQHDEPGTLIVMCGPDGSGKTTLETGLLARLSEHGAPTDLIMQPTDWWRGDRRVQANMVGATGALHPLALALFGLADRIDQQENVIKPALSAGRCVLSNRYLLSLVAHYLTTREIDQDDLRALYSRIIAPDVLVVLDAPTEVLLDRVVSRDGADSRRWDQQRSFVQRNRDAFRRLADDNGGLVLSTQDPADQVLDTVWNAVVPRLNAAGRAEPPRVAR